MRNPTKVRGFTLARNDPRAHASTRSVAFDSARKKSANVVRTQRARAYCTAMGALWSGQNRRERRRATRSFEESWQPRAESTRRYRLERAVSWAARRRGQISFARGQDVDGALCGDAVQSGSGGRTRTSNLLIQSQAFRQLNYPRSAG